MEQQVIDQDSSLDPEPTHTRRMSHNLPAPPNRPIGRDADIEKVSELIEAGREAIYQGVDYWPISVTSESARLRGTCGATSREAGRDYERALTTDGGVDVPVSR